MALNIDSKILLLVEGKDEVSFFEAVIEKLNLSEAKIQIIPVAGKGNFPNHLEALLNTPGFSDVNTIAIIRDADRCAEDAFKSILGLLKKHKLPLPDFANTFSDLRTPRIGVFIMPDNNSGGMLEDLCLRTVATNPIMECVNAFIECASASSTETPKNKAKAMAQAFLSVMPETVQSVGLGAKKGYWDFDHDCMANIIDFIQQLCLCDAPGHST